MWLYVFWFDGKDVFWSDLVFVFDFWNVFDKEVVVGVCVMSFKLWVWGLEGCSVGSVIFVDWGECVFWVCKKDFLKCIGDWLEGGFLIVERL